VLSGAFEHRRASRVRIAAAAVIVLAAGLYAAQRTWRAPAAPAVASAPAAMKTIATTPGQRATVTLADGSTLTLAPASRLTYAEDFGKSDRILHLEGEAHFVVAHDTTRPFIVRAGDTETRDIATAFAVRAYDSNQAVRVVVTEGLVAMRAVARAGDSTQARPEVFLSQGDVATSRAGSDPVVRHVGDVSRYVEWTQGRLRFTETPLPEAIAELGRWYGITIRIGDPSLRALRLTAVLDDQSAPQLSRILSIALGARVEREGDVMTLYRSEAQ
jgi:transmembrane sensor